MNLEQYRKASNLHGEIMSLEAAIEREMENAKWARERAAKRDSPRMPGDVSLMPETLDDIARLTVNDLSAQLAAAKAAFAAI